MEFDRELNIIETRFPELSTEIYDLLTDPDIVTTLEQISLESGISAEKHDMVIEEVGYVLFRINPLGALKEHFAHRLQIPASRAATLAAMIDRDVLAPVHDQLQKIEDSGFKPKQNSETTLTSKESGFAKDDSHKEPYSLINHVTQFQERKKMKEQKPEEGNDPYRESVS